MSRIRTLFVDDEEELVSAVVERLKLRDVEAHGASNGADALSQMATTKFDVVVLDVRMPGIGGLDVLRQLMHSEPATKVILLSGHGSAEDREHGLRLGAFDYLQKPVDIDVLLGIMRDAARERPHGHPRG